MHISSLFASFWVVGVDTLVANTPYSKLSGVALFIGVMSLIIVITRGMWPFDTEEGQTYAKQNKLFTIFCGALAFFSVCISIFMVIGGEWLPHF